MTDWPGRRVSTGPALAVRATSPTSPYARDRVEAPSNRPAARTPTLRSRTQDVVRSAPGALAAARERQVYDTTWSDVGRGAQELTGLPSLARGAGGLAALPAVARSGFLGPQHALPAAGALAETALGLAGPMMLPRSAGRVAAPVATEAAQPIPRIAREIGPNGMPIAQSQPYRNSLRGGSGDLREAAGMRAEAAQPVAVRPPPPPPAAPNLPSPQITPSPASLPMDEASGALGRRHDGGNAGNGQRVVYRGLNRPYDPNNGGYYQSFTSSADDAREYGPHVMAARINPGRNLAIDGGGNNFNSLSVAQLPADVRAKLHPSIESSATTDQIAHAAREAGYDSVTVRNVHDNRWGERPRTGQGPRTIDFVFDTQNITPVNAPIPQSQATQTAGKVRLSDADRALLDELEADFSSPQQPNAGNSPSLPMDEASRMGRAREQGFDTGRVLYRGQPARFEQLPENGTYVTSDPDYAANAPYVGHTTLPLFGRRNARLADVGSEIEDLGYRPDRIAELKAQGYDGARGRASQYDGDPEQQFIFDRANLRSIFAAFDPAKRDSSDLLALTNDPAADPMISRAGALRGLAASEGPRLPPPGNEDRYLFGRPPAPTPMPPSLVDLVDDGGGNLIVGAMRRAGVNIQRAEDSGLLDRPMTQRAIPITQLRGTDHTRPAREWVDMFKEDPSEFYPIQVRQRGRNRYDIIDGHHRTQAAREMGQTEIDAYDASIYFPEIRNRWTLAAPAGAVPLSGSAALSQPHQGRPQRRPSDSQRSRGAFDRTGR